MQFRRQWADLFRLGHYEPLQIEGFAADHVCAFAWRLPRRADDATGDRERVAVVAAPRLLARLAAQFHEEPQAPWRPLGETAWRDTRLSIPTLPADCPLYNHLTGQICPTDGQGMAISDVFAHFPVALLSNVALPQH